MKIGVGTPRVKTGGWENPLNHEGDIDLSRYVCKRLPSALRLKYRRGLLTWFVEATLKPGTEDDHY